MSDDPIDLESLKSYLAEYIGDADSVEVTGQGDGYSNETLFFKWDDQEFVLRRPPPDDTTGSAHDVIREYRILDALQETDVPVPETVLACEDQGIIGSEFYVMDRLEGIVIYTDEPERFRTPAHRERLGDEFVNALAAVHRVDYESVGLESLGRPEGYLERQVGVFSNSLDWASETTTQERDVPELYEVMEWLSENVPEEATHTLVHGDYKLDNVMFGTGTPPRIVGVLDWEMSTLGDPLSDLGFALLFWPNPPEQTDERAIQERFAPSFLEHPDYLSRAEFVEKYERNVGIQFNNRRFYLALAAFKTATVREMFYARYLRGGTDEPMYKSMGERVPAQARLAMRIIDGEWAIE